MMMRDLRYAARLLARSPGFTFVIVLTLAIGIGANTAIYSLLDAAILRPLPVEDPGGLIRLQLRRADGSANANLSYPDYEHYRDKVGTLTRLIAHSQIPLAVAGGGDAERMVGAVVSGNYFDALGVRPAVGRTFHPEEDRRGSPIPSAVISFDLWRRRFGSSPAAIGALITLNGQSFTVIGVAPAGFDGIVRGVAEGIWVPLASHPLLQPGTDYLDEPRVSWLDVMGRVERGASLSQVQASLAVLHGQLDGERSQPSGGSIEALPAPGGLGFMMSGLRGPLLLLTAVVGLLLLVACSNIANLMLSRVTLRRREMAIRLSLGATRLRLVRQLLTESVLLSLLGAVAGLFVALWAFLPLAGSRTTTGVPILLGARLDMRALLFTTLVAVVSGALIGLAPALSASRADLSSAVRSQAGDPARGPLRSGLRDLLVVSQVAMSLVVLVVAGLLTRSLRNLEAIDPGFGRREVLLASIDLEARGLDAERGLAFIERALERLNAIPGVRAASIAQTITPYPFGSRIDGVMVEGYTAAPDESIGFDVNVVGPGYFETLGIQILRGRPFDPRDRAGSPPVAIVNETFARRYWPDSDPMGKRVYLGPDSGAPSVEVIGVARDGRYRSLRDAAAPNVYFPALQRYRPVATLLIRSDADPMALAPAVRREMRALDPELPVYDVQSLSEHVGFALSQDRLAASLTGLFGATALALALLGIHGVVSWHVSHRTREIGIRMALGGRPRDILSLMVIQGLRPALAGLLVGAVGSVVAARLVSNLLFGLGGLDPLTLSLVPLMMVAAAALAAWIPARRATRVDPMIALRCE